MTEQSTSRRTILGMAAVGTGATLAAGSLQAQAQAQAQPGTLQQIRDRGELRIGVASGEPWFFKDQRSGDWHGIGWGVAVELAKALNVKPVPVETTWGNSVAGLQAGQFDVMFVLDPTPERALAIDFPVQPLLYYAQGLLIRDGLAASRWDDLNRAEVRIGVVLGSAMDREMTARTPKASIERFANQDETTGAFAAGRIDGLALFHPALVMLRNRVKRGQVVLPEPVRASATSAGVRREVDKSWRDWLGLAMAFLYTNGTTQKIYEDFLTSRGIDPKGAPAVMRESWSARS